jgi:DNA polymerase-3 subunit epsilon
MTAPNLILFYDTETSGLPLFDQPSEDPRQPHVVQLGAVLYDLDAREEVAALDLICRPVLEGPGAWSIPDEVAAIHGITTERALDEGIPEAEALEQLFTLWRNPDEPAFPRERVAHNEQFDARIIRIGAKRFFGDAAADEWKVGRARCTARLATPILKLPPTQKMRAAGRHHPKTPNLTEAHRHFFGDDFDGAHTALADARACLRVFLAIHDQAAARPVAA